jgi:hypothetical protein
MKTGFETYNELLFITILQDCNEAYAIWDILWDAQGEYYYCEHRRRNLQKLRDRIGYANFCLGLMPPVVPLAYFERLE